MYRFDITDATIARTSRFRNAGASGSRRRGTGTVAAVTFRPDAVRGAPPGGFSGVVDFRLARNSVVKEFRRGRLSRHDVCDAHPELLRNAVHCGRPAAEQCPICADADQPGAMVLVTYVFGSRLPPSGRCITSLKELDKFRRGTREVAAYVVEVCPDCHWNHLVRTFAVGGSAG